MEVVEALNKVRDLGAELQKLGSKITEVCQDDDTSAEAGISLLQAKTSTLMRYNRNLIRLSFARIKGDPIGAIAEKLVEDWVTLEKIRPIERKLRYQIDTLLKVSTRNSANMSEADRHRPNLSAMAAESEDEANGEGEPGVYRAPRIAEVVYDGGAGRKAERDKKERAKRQARAVRDEGVREMLAEVNGRPEEVYDDELGGSRKSVALQRLLREDEQRTRFEEENFTRLNVTRKDKKRRRDIERAMEGPALDGTDELAGLMAVADRAMVPKKKDSNKKSSADRDRDEEEYKMQQLDDITERMTGSKGKPSKLGRKKRKR